MQDFQGKSLQQIVISALGASQANIIIGNQKSHEVEVALIVAATGPKEADIRALWRDRSNNGDRKVLIAVEHGDRITLFGPAQDRQSVTLKSEIARRLIQNFLDAPDLLSAVREIVSFYDAHSTSDLGGIKNKGLFASHHLRENLPRRRDWQALRDQGYVLAEKRHRGLIEALGFQITKEERNAMVLRTESPESRVIALVLEDNETFEAPTSRFPSSPVSLGLSMAAEYNVPWLILVRKDQIRLHPCKDGVGVGQKGQAETYFELNISLLDDDNIGLLPLVFGAKSLSPGGEVDKLLGDSAKFAASLGIRLRERVYEQVVPPISIAVAKKLQEQGQELTSQTLQSAYSMTLKILFRLLFQAYAEDRGLLPAGRNEGFDANSLQELSKRHIDTPISAFGQSASIWYDLVQVWDAIDVGNEVWQIPAYNGGLFGSDPILHPEGAAIKQLQLPDSVLGPALQGLLIDATEDGVRGPVDFRALSVREFGTIYEGLLESSLSLADVDLTVDSSNAWVPAKGDEAVFASAGAPYFHSSSGERKATGSYFTPKFVVDHLVQKAIDPTIDKHLDRIAAYLRAGDTATAGREFFDFRVADLAMGSAHFLVAAVDRIEAKMRTFLAQPENTVPAVVEELGRLRKAAVDALKGDEIAISEVEDFSLLRRQIARRCIYGIDINYMAVELARLAIWIHTFVPGLPMSTLDHNLVHGNSLTGIGSIDEALDALLPSRKSNHTSFFDEQIESGLLTSKKLLIDAAAISEADKREIASARQLSAQAALATKDVGLVFDAAIAARLGLIDTGQYFDFNSFATAGGLPEVRNLTEDLRPAHLPLCFPEVFLRENAGFDALIGNPPWEKMQVEEHTWWGLRIPGLKGMPMSKRTKKLSEFRLSRPDLEREYSLEIQKVNFSRSSITKAGYPGLGRSNIDLYQAFAWRNWIACRRGGRLGLVLPRGAFSGSAMYEWRESILENGSFESVTFALNRGKWIFENVDTRYAIVFSAIGKAISGPIRLRGPVSTISEMEDIELSTIEVSEFKTWSKTLVFPNLPSKKSIEVFRQLMHAAKFGEKTLHWNFVAVQGDLNGTTNSDLFRTSGRTAEFTFPVFAGATFNLWAPDAGEPYGYSNSESIRSFQYERLLNASRNKKSAYFGLPVDKQNLPLDQARIGFRDITNATNRRTTIVCLLPPGIAGTHRVSFMVDRLQQPRNCAFLLGVMSSIPFDWYERRVVEMVLNFEILKSSPVPHDKLETAIGKRLINLASKLAAIDERFREWAQALEVQVGTLQNEVQKFDAICEIDALVCLLYNLSENQVEHIYETFHRGWDYKPRLNRVMEFYSQWKGKVDA